MANEGRVYHLGVAPGEIAQHIVLVGDPKRAELVAERFERVDVERRRREYVTLTGVFRGEPITVIGTGIGADNVEIALVEAHAAWCVDLETGFTRADAAPLTFLRIGTSGGAQEDVAPGTQAIAAYALGLDSCGLYYEGPAADGIVLELESRAAHALEQGEAEGSRFRGALRPYAARGDAGLVAALERSASALGAPSRTGVTCTLPGFYGPSGRYIERLSATIPDIKQRLGRVEARGQRVLNFEMESSLLFHLAGQLGHRTATICPIISTPGAHGGVIDYRPAVAQAIDIGLDGLMSG